MPAPRPLASPVPSASSSPMFFPTRAAPRTRHKFRAFWLTKRPYMTHTPVGGIADPRFFPSHDPAFASLPFSEAVQLGHLLFVSGQIGNAPGAITLVPGGIAAESKQALDNIRTILTRHGSALEHVVKFTVFLADMRSGQPSTPSTAGSSPAASRAEVRWPPKS